MTSDPTAASATEVHGHTLTGQPEEDPRSVVYRMSAVGRRFRLAVGRIEVASAVWRDQCWDIHGVDGGPPLMSLVGGSLDGHTRVALVDHASRRTATFVPAEPMSRSHIGVVRDSSGAVIMVVRADGPTGLHMINSVGELLALSSRRKAPDGHGCDVLVTPTGAATGRVLVFGVSLALELLRAGGLRRAA